MYATFPVLVLVAFGVFFGEAAHVKYARDESRKCDYCNFYEKTGLSPYELLWTVASEISPVLDDEERGPLLMNPEELQMAEKYYGAYCEEFCKTKAS